MRQGPTIWSIVEMDEYGALVDVSEHTEVPRISFANTGYTPLINYVTIDQNSKTDEGVNVGKNKRYGIVRSIEEGQRESRQQHPHIQVRHPSLSKPNKNKQVSRPPTT